MVKKIFTTIILMCLLSLFGCSKKQNEVVFGPTLPGESEMKWNDTFSLAYAGWCRFYIAEIDNIPCLIRYFPPTARQGSWECYLQVYTLNSDNEFATSEQIVCDGTEENAEECKAIAEQYLEHAVMVVSTMDSELKVYQ